MVAQTQVSEPTDDWAAVEALALVEADRVLEEHREGERELEERRREGAEPQAQRRRGFSR